MGFPWRKGLVFFLRQDMVCQINLCLSLETRYWKSVFADKHHGGIVVSCSEYNYFADTRWEVLAKGSHFCCPQQCWPLQGFKTGTGIGSSWAVSALGCEDLPWNQRLSLQSSTTHPAPGHQGLTPLGSSVNKYLPLHRPGPNWADL